MSMARKIFTVNLPNDSICIETIEVVILIVEHICKDYYKEHGLLRAMCTHESLIDSSYNFSITNSWWRHQMETFSALLAICAGNSPGTFPLPTHDDVIKWKHFPRYWPFVRGIHRSPVNSPHKGQWRGDLMFCLICVWINDWEYNREAGDLRRYRTHYDVTVMFLQEVCYKRSRGHSCWKLQSGWTW